LAIDVPGSLAYVRRRPTPDDDPGTRARAIAITEYGGAERLTNIDLPVSDIAADQVPTSVRAAGVGPWDYLIREGRLGTSASFPLTLGFEVAGTVERLGDQVSGLAVGDEVYSYCWPAGGYAEFVAANQSAVAHKPTTLDFVHAAAVPVCGLTAHQGIVDELGVSDGDTVLLIGAAGGVGSFAVQIAAARSARVIAHARPENADYVRNLGAAELVDYGNDDWPATVRDAHPDGVDAVLDCVGGQSLAKGLGAVRAGGRVASIVVYPPPPPAPDGVTFRTFGGHADRQRLDALAALVDAGELQVSVQAVLELEQAAAAHGLLDAARCTASSCCASNHSYEGVISVSDRSTADADRLLQRLAGNDIPLPNKGAT